MNIKAQILRQQAVTFKRWERKGFSVFRSLKKVIRIGTLCAVYLVCSKTVKAEIFSGNGNDTIRTDRQIEVDEVQISAQRSTVLFSESARIVNVLRKEDFQQAPAHSVGELLEYIAGIDIRQRGDNGIQADISIKGSSFDQVLILLNGININDPQTGHHNLNIPVSFDLIERIEIIEGASSRVYGPNAFSGAINIVTSNGEESKVKARFSYGLYNYFDSSLSTSLKSKNLSNSFSIDYKLSDGAIKNTDFKRSNFFYHLNYNLKRSTVDLQTSYTNNQFGANSFYTPIYPNQFEQTNTSFLSLKAKFDGNHSQLTASAYLRRNKDRFELFREMTNAPGWYKNHNYHQTDTYGFNMNGWMRLPFGKISFGADYRNEKIISNVLGKPMTTTLPIKGANGLAYNYSDKRSNLGLYSEYALLYKNYSVSAGVLCNVNSVTRQLIDFYPGLDISWKPSNQLNFYASVNKSLRIPTFTDLYYKSSTNIGNPLLQPEEALSTEFGIKYKNKWLKSDLILFNRKGKNLIDWARKPDETIWHAMNINSINSSGFEVSSQIALNKLFNKNTFIRSFDFSYAWLTQQKSSDDYISKYVLDYLKHHFSIGLMHLIGKNFSANWKMNYQDRNGTFTLWDGNKYGNEIQYAPFILLDARGNWQIRKILLYLEAKNLLNKKYYDFGNVEQAGIWVKFGIEINMIL